MLVVELVGLEPTTRVLWNVGVSDQLTLSDTKHSSSKRPAIDGHFHKSGNLRCARMRGGAGRTRTSNQTVSPTSSPKWRTTQFGSLPKDVRSTPPIFAPSVSNRKIRFPGKENRGCGDAVGMRMRASVRRFANSGVMINISAVRPAAGRMRINMGQVRGFGVAAPIRWANHRG